MTQYNSHSTAAVLEESKYEPMGQQVTRAAIFCTDEYEVFGNIAQERPIWLLPIAGRPMLDRILGHLTDFGIKNVDLFVSHHAIDTYKYVAGSKKNRNKKENTHSTLPTPVLGSRWGLDVKIIDVTNTQEGLRRLVYRELDEPLLIGNATAMPPLAVSFPGESLLPIPDQLDDSKGEIRQQKKDIRVSHPILFRDTMAITKTAWMIARPECFVSEHCRSLENLATTMESSDEVEVV